MRLFAVLGLIWALICWAAPAVFAQPKPLPESGFRQIFNGNSLDGWDCDPAFWRVENGEIVGETTASHQPAQNTFCIFKAGRAADFELRLQYKLTPLLP